MPGQVLVLGTSDLPDRHCASVGTSDTGLVACAGVSGPTWQSVSLPPTACNCPTPAQYSKHTVQSGLKALLLLFSYAEQYSVLTVFTDRRGDGWSQLSMSHADSEVCIDFNIYGEGTQARGESLHKKRILAVMWGCWYKRLLYVLGGTLGWRLVAGWSDFMFNPPSRPSESTP